MDCNLKITSIDSTSIMSAPTWPCYISEQSNHIKIKNLVIVYDIFTKEVMSEVELVCGTCFWIHWIYHNDMLWCETRLDRNKNKAKFLGQILSFITGLPRSQIKQLRTEYCYEMTQISLLKKK